MSDARRGGNLMWQPSDERCRQTTLHRYTQWLAAESGLHFSGYDDLWNWSVTDIDAFWASLWDFFDIRVHRPYDRVLDSRGVEGARWFAGSELSYAEHVFRGKRDDAIALVHMSELRSRRETTWGELRALTARIASALRAVGVERGDRVVAYLPNIPEAVAGFLASASIGAVWSSCSPDFGARSVVDRFAQISPKVLLAVDGYRYGGRDFDRLETLAEVRREIPGLQEIVVLPYLRPRLARSELAGMTTWDSFLARGDRAELSFEPLPFDHPLWVLYSSGTTGLPKAIVHGQGGILLEHLKTLHLHMDAQPGNRLFWFTTTGWMMWNLLVGGLLTDAAIVLYDGSPGYPDMGVLWDLAEATRMTCFGTSAALISASMKGGIVPRAGRDLSALRSVGSTGSPLSADGFRWIYDHVGEDTWLFSMSGGTDVCSAFVGGVPTLPVYEGELQARALGAKVEAFDEHGRPLVGEVG